ncbi:uncharacterized protein LOC125510976 isoform X1 [Triticum urartu]|uniref:uncharacterized protein LOC125510976 isoform X1 n=1 Tax=Triticum urartu TaxID=4572 RepID=UPI002042C72E|nr:uncharacterized protein LOC125510976 isoform X1 [Triticum urartu]
MTMEPPDPPRKRTLPCEEGDGSGKNKKARSSTRGGESDEGDGSQGHRTAPGAAAPLPWFLDWIDFGANNVEPHTVPRISVYTGQICRRLIYLIREYPNIFTTKPYDAFNPLDDVWHGVVGEYGGFLQQPE